MSMPEVSDRAIQIMVAMREEFRCWDIVPPRPPHTMWVVHDQKRSYYDAKIPISAAITVHHEYHKTRESATDWVTARSIQVGLDKTHGHKA